MAESQTTTETLKPCPFCGGPAEQRLADGPRRGFIGCFSCMIGTPFNVPYGARERAQWNARADASAPTPLCAVHKRLEDADTLECEIGNDCVACSLNERRELLALIAPFAAEGNTEDSVSVLRRVVDFYENHAAPASPAAPSRHYFCSCGGALTAEEYIEHYFEKGHDRGEPGFKPVDIRDEAERQFPIHPSDSHLLKSVPWSLVALHEKQAQANHDQSLERLAQRGGLSLIELFAVLNDRSWHPHNTLPTIEESLAWIKTHIAAASTKRCFAEGEDTK